MKALILIALLAITAQATFNSTAYRLGLADQLDFTNAQLEDLDQCFDARHLITETAEDLVISIQQESVGQALIDIVSIYNLLVRESPQECIAFGQDLIELVPQYINNPDFDLKEFANQRSQEYAVQLIQQVAIWIEELISGNYYQAGATEGYIIQVILGAEEPAQIVIPTFNASNIVPVDLNRLFPEYFKGLYNYIGDYNQTEIDIAANCAGVFVNATTAINPLISNISQAEDIQETVVLIGQIVEKLLPVADACGEAWEVQKPHLEQFLSNLTIESAVQYALNALANLPEIISDDYQISIDISEGKYEEAGAVKGEIRTMVFGRA